MQCRQIQERLSAYSADNVSPGERARIAAHLSECAACSKEMHSLTTVIQWLDTMPDREPPRDMWVAIFDRLERRPVRRAQPSLLQKSLWSAFAGVAVAVVLAGGVWFYSHGTPAPTAPMASMTPQIPAITASAATSRTWAFVNQHAAMAQDELFANRSALAVMTNYPANGTH